MAKKSVAKNYLYNLMYQILVMIIPLITTPYLSRVLGANNIGIYSYTLSITTYFILFGSLGVAMYGQREIAYVQDDEYERSKRFYEILLLRFLTLGTSLLIFYNVFCIKGQYAIYYRILILELVANSIDISWFFQGMEEFKKTVIRNLIVKILSVTCIFMLVRTKNDLNTYFTIYVLSTFLGNLTLWLYLPKNIKKIKIKELNIKRHIKPTIALFIPQIAVQIYTVLDKTMIGTIISNKSEVGYYEQAQKMVKLIMLVATSLGTVMMPRIANSFANGNKEKIKEYMNISFSFILMLAFPLTLGFISVCKNFVPLFYGKGYDAVTPLICTISPIIVIIGLSNIIGTQYLLPTKQQKKFTASVAAGALTNFILNLTLIPKYAAIGASIATVIAEIVVTTIQFILVRKDIKILNVIKVSYKYLIASIIMFIVSITVDSLISSNIIAIISQVIVSGITYILILIILKDKMIFNGIDILKRKLKLSK